MEMPAHPAPDKKQGRRSFGFLRAGCLSWLFEM
jgi:hypothetical protein